MQTFFSIKKIKISQDNFLRGWLILLDLWYPCRCANRSFYKKELTVHLHCISWQPTALFLEFTSAFELKPWFSGHLPASGCALVSILMPGYFCPKWNSSNGQFLPARLCQTCKPIWRLFTYLFSRIPSQRFFNYISSKSMIIQQNYWPQPMDQCVTKCLIISHSK